MKRMTLGNELMIATTNHTPCHAAFHYLHAHRMVGRAAYRIRIRAVICSTIIILASDTTEMTPGPRNSTVRWRTVRLLFVWLCSHVVWSGATNPSVFFVWMGGEMTERHHLCVRSAAKHHEVTLYCDASVECPDISGVYTQKLDVAIAVLGTPLQVKWSPSFLFHDSNLHRVRCQPPCPDPVL